MDEQALISRVKALIQRFDNLRIVGEGWSGSARQGFQFNPGPAILAALGGGTPPPPATGACCVDEVCSITTVGGCMNSGGTYQGDDTTCDPNPCTTPATGACCDGEDCSITTEEDCTGEYQGDDTTCDPNPCELPSCGACGFDAFDGSGRKFLTSTAVVSATEDHTFNHCHLDFSGTEIVQYDPISCDLNVISCSGSGSTECDSVPDPRSVDAVTLTTGCGVHFFDCGNCAGACDTITESGPYRSYFPSSPLNVVDATHAYRECSNDDSNLRVDIFLSDECIPGFSPPP